MLKCQLSRVELDFFITSGPKEFAKLTSSPNQLMEVHISVIFIFSIIKIKKMTNKLINKTNGCCCNHCSCIIPRACTNIKTSQNENLIKILKENQMTYFEFLDFIYTSLSSLCTYNCNICS